jgi:uncharacterized protein (UPF0335 family)
MIRMITVVLLQITFASWCSVPASAGDCGLCGKLTCCHKPKTKCNCCDDTVVIHCYCDGKKDRPANNDPGFGNTSGAVGGAPTLIPYQQSFGTQMMPMVMPMMYGAAAASASNFNNNSAQVASQCGNYLKRIERIEKDFKKLGKQVDEIVVAVDRNTVALERIAEILKAKGMLKTK